MNCFIYVCTTLVVLLRFDIIEAENSKNSINVTKLVDSINKNVDLPWKADSYGEKDLNVELFVQTKLGVKLDTERPKNQSPKKLKKQATYRPNEDHMGLPESFTWADKKNTNCPISHIRDQSNCGSCWAVSTAAVLSDRFCIQSKGKTRPTLSQEFVTSCDTKNKACSGGYMDYVNDFMVKNGTITGGDYDSDDGCQQYTVSPCGFPSESEFPCAHSSAINPKCKLRKCNNDWHPYKYEPDENVFKAKDWYFVKANYSYSREDRIREEIYKGGPVTAAFYVLSDFTLYKKGIYIPSPRAYIMGGHAVRLVGWGVEDKVKYWHVANSWSTKWGEGGFFRIVRGVNAVGFESMISALTPKL